jgi:hypothetical protein
VKPQSYATAPAQQNQARRRRHRNPAVAHYLGLPASLEPEHPDKYALLPDEPDIPAPKPVRKRRKLTEMSTAVKHTNSGTDKMFSRPKRISEGLRVTKTRHKPAVQSKTSAADASQPYDNEVDAAEKTVPSLSSEPDSRHISHNIAVKRTGGNSAGQSSQIIFLATPSNPYADTQHLAHGTNDHNTNDPDRSDWPEIKQDSTGLGDEDFDIDLDDDELLRLTSDMVDTGGMVNAMSSLPIKSSMTQSKHKKDGAWGSTEDTIIALDDDTSNSQPKSKKFVSPVTLTTRLLAATGDFGSADARKPIVRPSFPLAVRDRSPIIGLSSNTLLRTCFRIGEAVNQAHQASKSGNQVVFELYARILDSERDATSQHFTFCDLFHAKPPYIKAIYDGALWKSIQLFSYDSARLLQQGRICRCMGKMKREGKEWVMTVLNIWEATWDDIRWVEGIVNS